MKDIETEALLQEFTDTHNKIIQTLNNAEKGHAETLVTFIEELEKRKSSIEGVNTGIDAFNDLIKSTSVRLVDLNTHINELSVVAGDIDFKIKNLQKNVTTGLQAVGKKAFKDFLLKSRFLLILNVVIVVGLIYIVLSHA